MQDQTLQLSRRSLLRSAGWLSAGLAGSALMPARLLAQPSVEQMYPALTNLVYEYVASGRLPGAVAALGWGSNAPMQIARGTMAFDSATPVELVAVRLVGRTPAPSLELGVGQAVLDHSGERLVYFGQRWGLMRTPVVARTALRQPTNGPLLIDEYDSTTVIPPDAQAWLDDQGQLVMELRDGD